MYSLVHHASSWLRALFIGAIFGGSSAAAAYTAIAAAEHTVMFADDGSLQVTGLNLGGQLGLGDTFSRRLVHTLNGFSGATDVWVGYGASYLRKSDGTLWACGSSSYGLSGHGGSSTPVTTFRQVGTATDWKQVSIGVNHVLAVRSDGSLWSWGSGSSGELGQGSIPIRTTPTRIGTANDWSAVAAGNEHSLALKTTGTLWAWGRNESGRLGDGTSTNRNVPVQIGSSTQWKAISAGAAHSLALQTGGSLWAWGANNSGQLGDGSNTSRNTPTFIDNGMLWKSISAGSHHSLGLRMDDTLHAWGANASGQLGLGDSAARNTPQPVAAGETWLAIDAGFTHSVAIRGNGSVAWWGANTYGQLGPVPATVNTPVGVDATTRQEISVAPQSFSYNDNSLLTSGTGSLNFSLTAEGAPQTKNILIYNHGTEPLELSAFHSTAGFITNGTPTVSLAPGGMMQLGVTIDTTVTGDLTGSLTITSNDADETEFVVQLAGRVLARVTDEDQDGLNDAAEWHLSGLGFRWNEAQPQLVTNLLENAPRAGLFTNSQLAAARPGSVILGVDAITGRAGMRLHLEQSAGLESFIPADLTGAAISNGGRLVVPIDASDPKSFFRSSAKAPPSTTP